MTTKGPLTRTLSSDFGLLGGTSFFSCCQARFRIVPGVIRAKLGPFIRRKCMRLSPAVIMNHITIAGDSLMHFEITMLLARTQMIDPGVKLRGMLRARRKPPRNFSKANHNGCNLMSNGTYDIIIIGSGAGGGTLARQLAPSGKSILLLECGDQDLSQRETGG